MKVKLIYPIFLLMIAMGGCEKDTLADSIEIIDPDAQTPDDHTDPENGEEDPTPTDPDNGGDDQTPDTPQDQQTTVLTGDANGKLLIDGTQKQYDCNTTLAIKGGQYNRIEIRNLHGQAGCPIRIENHGLVEFIGYRKTMSISNVSHVMISGDGDKQMERGFSFRDNEYRSVSLKGPINHFIFQHIEFRNIGNRVIYYDHDPVYDGSAASYSENLKFLNLSVEESGMLLYIKGSIKEGVMRGLVKNLEIANVHFANAPTPKNVVYVGLADGYDIHHNTFNNVNKGNDNHNAMFHIIGNGRFYNNRISQHQGNALRAWLVSIGTTPRQVEIFNNIVTDSRKYSAFEVQSFTDYMIHGKTTFAHAKVYHNTCGNLNLSQDWYGVVLDAYRLLGGKCEVYNNLAYYFPSPHPRHNIISYMSVESDNVTESNNIYFNSAKAAGLANQVSFQLLPTSDAVTATTLPLGLTYDFHGNRRNSTTPTIGAVEH